jgi:hypothetical protein
VNHRQGLDAESIDERLRHIEDYRFSLLETKARTSARGIGALAAIRRGLAIVDTDGFLRCPPGTPNAMQFTNTRGLGCGTGSILDNPAESRIGGRARRTAVDLPSLQELARRRGESIDDRIFSAEQIAEATRIADERIARIRAARDSLPRRSQKRKQIASTLKGLLTGTKIKGRTTYDERIERLREVDNRFTIDISGFTPDVLPASDVQRGFAISRPGTGIRIRSGDLFDDTGSLTDEARVQVAEFMAVNADTLSDPVDERAFPTLGGWHSDRAHDVNGNLLDQRGEITTDPRNAISLREAEALGIEAESFVYLDVTDVFDPDQISEEEAIVIGRERNQQGIYKIHPDEGEEWGRTIDTGGTGGDLMPEGAYREAYPYAVRNVGAGTSSAATARDSDMRMAFNRALRSLGGDDTLDLENFTEEEKKTMLQAFQWVDPKTGKTVKVPGFEWVDPNNPDDVYWIIDQLATNTTALMRMADPDPEEAARKRQLASTWYNKAHDIAQSWADEYNLPLSTVVAVIAQLSPQTEWGENLAEAHHKLKLLSDQNYTVEEDVARLAIRMLKRRKDMQGVKFRLNDIKGKKLADIEDERFVGAILYGHMHLRSGSYMQGGRRLGKMTKYAGTLDSPLGKSKDQVGGQSVSNYIKVVRAFRTGGVIDEIEKDAVIGAQSKVRSFFNNIFNPDDLDHLDVTIDTWQVGGMLMLPTAANHHITTKAAFEAVKSHGASRGYPVYRAAIMLAAARWEEETGEKYLPRAIQSITWEISRDLMKDTKGRRLDGKPVFLETAAQIQERVGMGLISQDEAARQFFELTEVMRLPVKRTKKKPAPVILAEGLKDFRKRIGLPDEMTGLKGDVRFGAKPKPMTKTIEEVADLIGISPSTLKRWMEKSGWKRPSDDIEPDELARLLRSAYESANPGIPLD